MLKDILQEGEGKVHDTDNEGFGLRKVQRPEGTMIRL